MRTEIVELESGRRFGVERFGDPEGKPMLFFHGLPGSRLELRHEGPLFASHGLAVIATDRPGFGLSTRRRERTMLDWPEDVRLLADRWELERFAVVGYSGGGRYALACAAAMPERISTAAVIAGPAPPEMPGSRRNLAWLDRASLALAGPAPLAAAALWRPIRWLVLNRPQRFARLLGREVSHSDREYLADPAARGLLLESLAEGFRQGVGAVVDEYAIDARPWGFAPEEIRVPVRIWHGDDDQIVPLPHSPNIADRVPGARLEVVNGAGHFLGGTIDRVARAIATES
jgi:pimeloyl-ACP methyl ester carboxylesterase